MTADDIAAENAAVRTFMSVAVRSLAEQPVEGLCNKQGARFDGRPPTGKCVYLAGHHELHGQQKHSWETE